MRVGDCVRNPQDALISAWLLGYYDFLGYLEIIRHPVNSGVTGSVHKSQMSDFGQRGSHFTVCALLNYLCWPQWFVYITLL
jgi:hypothetical protein